MPAYLIADIELHDAEQYREYVEHVPALIEKHGGKYLVRGGNTRTLEGAWRPSRLVVLQFPDREAAMALYEDPDYAPYRNLRQSIADTRLILAEGHDEEPRLR